LKTRRSHRVGGGGIEKQAFIQQAVAQPLCFVQFQRESVRKQASGRSRGANNKRAGESKNQRVKETKKARCG